MSVSMPPDKYELSLWAIHGLAAFVKFLLSKLWVYSYILTGTYIMDKKRPLTKKEMQIF